ncbi:D-alanyl-D-alanine carboxypeptidase family protein [Aquabacter sp. P-9]|uniref:D-alanyl-D-alanine carboxypeptidase family protein n=1 Tax=Aquabacter sediminis TaxID=3029197 RepID=UPI00237D6F4E|nr:D-alanyl-D-alanine carboxypeptidase family protein [Aquabacter sp. P-9]MDE1569335.1 D-alanyl-D-alanine carboxypeptidase [Aquabacter sp. P-9]
MPGFSSLRAGVVLRQIALAAVLIGLLGTAARATPMLLVEADTGKVLEQQEAGRPWYPASVTKLMTVYVALNAVREGRLTMETMLTVSPLAASQQPTKMGFGPGSQVPLDSALKMLMVKSANDIAVVIAEGVGGSVPDFVAEMNSTAQQLGMTGSHFENPNGLPNPEQYTTARDLAVLARALIYHFPENEMLFRIPAIRLGKIVLRNYNRLIDRYPGADGMKTGFICASGFNLVATATRGNKRLIAVILGAPSAVARTEQAALLFEKGFQPSWSIFGAASPTLDTLANVGGTPPDMNICNRKRAVAAAENEDDNLYNQGESSSSYAMSAAVAAGLSKGEGAALLQNLPPSMPPVPVTAIVRMPPAEEKADKKTGVAIKDSKDPASGSKQKTAVISTGSDKKPDAASASKPAAKDTSKDGAKATTSAKDAGAKSTSSKDAKPAGSSSATAAATPAPKPAAKPKASSGTSDSTDPLTFGPPPARPGT